MSQDIIHSRSIDDLAPESSRDSWTTFQRQLAAFRRSPVRWIVFAYLALLVVVTILCAWAAARPYRARAARYRAQMVRLQRENATLQTQLAAAHNVNAEIARLEEANRKLLAENTQLRQQTQTTAVTNTQLKERFAELRTLPPPRIPVVVPRPLPLNVRPIPGSAAGVPPTHVKPADVRPAATPLVTLNDAGGQVALESDGSILGLNPVPAPLRQRVKSALQSRQVETAGIVANLASNDAGRSGDSVAVPRSPAGKVLRTDRPFFRWTPVAGATGYVVTVISDPAGFEMKSDAVSGTEWRASKPLPRGKDYRWQVTPQQDGKEATASSTAPTARFHVLDETAATELDRAEQTYAAQSHLTLGVLYAQYGLLDDAEQQLRALLSANRGSAVARGLLQSVQDAKRR